MQGREREEEEGRREFLFSPSLSSFSSSYLPPRPPPAPPDDFSSSSLVTRTPYYPLFVSPSSSSSSSSSFRNQDQRPPLLLSHLPACSTSSLPSSSSCVDSDFLAFRRSHRSPSQSFISSSTEEEREKEEDEEERKQFSLSHCSSRVFPPSVRDKSQTLLSSSSSCMYRNGEGSPSEEERNLPKDQEEEKEKKQNEEDGCLRSVEARLRRNKDTSEMRWARRERRRIERSEGSSSFFYPRNSHQQTSSPRGLSPSHLSFVSSSLPLSLEEEASALFPSLVSSSGDLSFFFSNRENSVLSSPAHLSHPPCVLDRVRSLQQASLLSAYYCQRGREEKKKDEERRRRRERERRGEKMRKNGKETTSRDRDKEEIDAEETGRRNRRTGPSFFLSREDTEEEEEIKDAVFFNERGRNVEDGEKEEDIGENTREDQFVAREKEGVSIPSSSSFGMAAGAVYRHLRTGANETFFTCLCRSRQSPSEICRSSSSLLSCYEKVDQRSNRLPAVGLDKVSTRKVEKPLSTRNLFYSHDEEEVEEEGDFFLRDISLPLVLQDLVFDSLLFLPSTSFISPLSSPASSLLLTLQRSRRRRRSKEKRKVLLSSSFSSSSLSLSREKMTSDLHGMSWLASSGMFRLMCWSLLNRRFSIEVSRLVQDSKVLLAFPSLYICLARALLNLDRVDDLLKLLTVDIPYGRLHPSISASLHVLLGDAYEALGSISHSIDALSTSVSYLHALHASTESSDEEEEEKNLLSFSTHSFSYPFSFLQHKRLQKKQLSSSFFSPSPSSSSSPPHSCSSPSSVSSLSSSSSLDENLEAPEEEEEEIPHAVINKSKEKKEKKRKKKKTEEEESQREDSLVSLFALSSKEALRKKKKRKRKIKDEEEERRRRREISPCMHFSIVGALDRLIGRGRLSPREEEKTIRNLLLLSLLPSSERWWSDFFASRLSFSSGSDYYFHRKRKRGRASPSNLSLSSSSYLRFSSSSSHLLSPSSSSSFEDFTMSIEDGNPLACWETAHFLLSHSPSSLPRPLAVSSALLSNPYDEEALALRAFSLYHIGDSLFFFFSSSLLSLFPFFFFLLCVFQFFFFFLFSSFLAWLLVFCFFLRAAGRRRARTVSSLENLLLSPFSSSPLPPLLRGLAHLVRREEKEGREEEEEEEEEESLHLAKNCFLLACDRIRMQQTSPCSSSSLRVSTWELLFMTFQALSEVYRHLKEFDLVQTISVRALSLQPGNSQVYLHLGMDYLQESEACQEEAERKDFLTRADLFLTRALIDCAVTYLEKAVLCSVYTPLLSSIFLCNLGIAYLQTKAFRRSQKTFEASLLSYRRHVQHSSSSFSPSLFSRNRVFSLLSPSSLSFFLKKKERDEAYLSYFLLKKSDRSCRRSRNVFLSSYRNLFSKRILKKKRQLLFSQRCAMTESFFTRNEREEEEEGRRRRENLMKSLLEAGDKRALKEERFREKKEREKEEEKSIEEEEDYQEEEDSTVSSLDENVLEGEDEESGEEDLVAEEEREEEERNEKEFLINLWFGLGMALYVQRDSRCIRSLEKALSLTKSLGLPFSQDSYLASSSLPFLPMKDFSLSSSSPSQGVASYPFLILLVYIAALNDLGPSSSFSSLKTSSFFLDHPLHNEEEEEDEREEVLSVSSLLASMLSSRSCMRSEEERETGDKPHDKRRAAKRIEQSLQRQERRVDKEEEEKRRRGEDGRDTSSEKVVSFFSPKRDRNKSAREREKERTERFYEEILRNFDASNLQQEEEKL
ncbi:tetratricopeptide repeat-containing protein [Cystoisospora suis]|uniref:Tetratricopeptide repeat-containing protein n=1 Tax=Cystoisospora suis TaxID=483139 RepID=A0A2C6KXV8_9APIC|nr:tetratricopeptide repeat-containing protein [Cystoisospora suis]